MNKEEYIEKLSKDLKKLPKEDREDILSDYEEHFLIGMENGRTEEEISEALGKPEIVSKQIKAEYMVKKAENRPSTGSVIEAVLAVAGLGLVNLIFIAIPALGLAAVILSLVVTGLSVILVGILTMLSPILHSIFPQYIDLPIGGGIMGTFLTVVGGIGLTVMGTFFVILMAYIANWFYRLIIKHLKLNLEDIKERAEILK
ncbi:HAAS signaling domain-containing protein [Methanobacterium sp. ACI-7]|uniref:HAAS signaling domain-containing protein n=1 Tax=unclassified Methanobacterium TaxID=2627676 RepID=UPI0039C37E13